LVRIVPFESLFREIRISGMAVFGCGAKSPKGRYTIAQKRER
jgi:hypothetical protein